MTHPEMEGDSSISDVGAGCFWLKDEEDKDGDGKPRWCGKKRTRRQVCACVLFFLLLTSVESRALGQAHDDERCPRNKGDEASVSPAQQCPIGQVG